MLTTAPKFLRVLYDILHVESSTILSWSSCGTYFQVFDVARLEQDVLPRYFKHSIFASFQRQLNNFGFRKWTKTRASVCTFSHNALVRCAPSELLTLVTQSDVVLPHTKVGSGKRTRTNSENSETTDSGSDCDSMCYGAKKLRTAEDGAEDESLRMLLDGMFVNGDEFEFFGSLKTSIKDDDDELDWLLPEAEEKEEFVELVELWDGLFDSELPLETEDQIQWPLCSMGREITFKFLPTNKYIKYLELHILSLIRCCQNVAMSTSKTQQTSCHVLWSLASKPQPPSQATYTITKPNPREKEVANHNPISVLREKILPIVDRSWRSGGILPANQCARNFANLQWKPPSCCCRSS